ncbi:MAG: right-handed parallel beta-helix repeat-containing protein [Muribaculaceae bacterium]|nr:right-handed parallel beta-helix repeat-containing protein [Muribaculaceae bacterium]
MLRYILISLLLISCGFANADKVIKVPFVKGDATSVLRKVINEAATYKGEKVIIELPEDTLHFSRINSSEHLYHISNTTSQKENPNATKHIGIWLKQLDNVTIEGNGCLILTHGEMTPFVIDSCRNIVLRNFRLDAADPSVVEIDITDKDEDYISFYVLPPTNFEFNGDSFSFVGEGWQFGDNQRNSNHVEYAQIYYPEDGRTLRKVSPMKNYAKAVLIGDRLIRMDFEKNKVPSVSVGERYQLRHGIRNEVCMFINRSEGIKLSDIVFNFMGNFGIVGQFSENLTYERIKCQPLEGSGRTNTGFADFLQFSSCRGLLRIIDSIFEGSQDDPINIHGTHLQIEQIIDSKQIIIGYKHPQTYGFLPCEPGDELMVVNRKTLNDVGEPIKVAKIDIIDDYRYCVSFQKDLPVEVDFNNPTAYVVENISWIPEVIIKGNSFKSTPTRAILITTRSNSLIEGNKFYNIPMASILVANDARSWYESGPVKQLTIRNNAFYNCNGPVIAITPEVETCEKPVHENINIENNRFIMPGLPVIKIYDSANIKIVDNLLELSPKYYCEPQEAIRFNEIIELNNVTNSIIHDNHIKQTDIGSLNQ